MRRLLPIRAVALAVVAVFGFHMSRFYLVADLADFNCPHHVRSMRMGVAPQGEQGAMQHGNHTMPQSKQSHPGTHPGGGDSGMRCCCRQTLDGLITTLVLYSPGDLANAPLPDGVQGVSLAADLAVREHDLNPPFIPPRV